MSPAIETRGGLECGIPKGIAQLEEYADIAGTNQLIASRGTATRHIEGCTVSEERTARGRSVHQEVVCGYRS